MGGAAEKFTSAPALSARRKAPPREFRVGICSEIPAAPPLGGGDDDDGVRLTFRDVFDLITPRLLFAGGANVVGCMAFGVVQPMLSLYLTRSPLNWNERGIGWAQGCVSLGYMLGVRPAHRAVARGVRAEGLCGLGALISGACLLRIGAGAASSSGSGGGGAGGSEWKMLVTLFCFGLAQSAALVPTLEAMKTAALKTGPLAAEGAVRLFNVFQDLGQVTGPVVGGVAMSFYGFERAATTLGAVSAVYAVVMLVYLASVRPLPRNQTAAHFTFTGTE